jgi:hypothetical protein
MKELARRAVVCKHWRWMPGMLVTFPPTVCTCRRNQLVPTVRLIPADAGGCFNIHERGVCGVGKVPQGALPDLTDPATLGCLLALVREAFSDIGLSVSASYANWRYAFNISGGHAHGGSFNRMAATLYSTEAEALVAALERAQ